MTQYIMYRNKKFPSQHYALAVPGGYLVQAINGALELVYAPCELQRAGAARITHDGHMYTPVGHERQYSELDIIQALEAAYTSVKPKQNVSVKTAPKWAGEPAVTPKVYPDNNPKSVQGAKKVPLGHVPSTATAAMASAFADGCKKYGKANWRETGVSAEVYIHAAMRHIALWYDGGEERASDSNCPHLGHAMACLGIIIDAQAAGKLVDDRPNPIANLQDLFTIQE